MSKKVHNILAKGGMMTNSWIPHGKKFIFLTFLRKKFPL